MPQLSLHSPVGDLTVSEKNGLLVSLDWGWVREQAETPLLSSTKSLLNAYFDGDLQDFDLPLNLAGTAHQGKVWQAMMEIPYGVTESYGELARRIGSGAQAVGTACSKNPIAIIVPCHRVLAARGAIGGYSGGSGVATKTVLLRLEGSLFV